MDEWGPAQDPFGTVGLSLEDWLLTAAVASRVLIVEEIRKRVARLFA